MNSDFYNGKYAHFLKPIKDITKNWEIDIGKELEEYIEDFELYSGNEVSCKFAQAAMILKGSLCLYSSKVDYLYALVNTTKRLLAGDNQVTENERPDSNGPIEQRSVTDFCFKNLDNLIVTSNINSAGETLPSSSLFNRPPPVSLQLMEESEKPSVYLRNSKYELIGNKYDFRLGSFNVDCDGMLVPFNIFTTQNQTSSNSLNGIPVIEEFFSTQPSSSFQTSNGIPDTPLSSNSPPVSPFYPSPDSFDCSGLLASLPTSPLHNTISIESEISNFSSFAHILSPVAPILKIRLERLKGKLENYPPNTISIEDISMDIPFENGVTPPPELNLSLDNTVQSSDIDTTLISVNLDEQTLKQKNKPTTDSIALLTPVSSTPPQILPDSTSESFYDEETGIMLTYSPTIVRIVKKKGRKKRTLHDMKDLSLNSIETFCTNAVIGNQSPSVQRQIASSENSLFLESSAKKIKLDDTEENNIFKSVDIINGDGANDDNVNDDDDVHNEPFEENHEEEQPEDSMIDNSQLTKHYFGKGKTITKYVDNILLKASENLKQTDIQKKVHEWESKVNPQLRESENHELFDLDAYNKNILNQFHGEKKMSSLSEICGRKTAWEISRNLVACLHLANYQNIEINSNEDNDLEFGLLSKKLVTAVINKTN